MMDAGGTHQRTQQTGVGVHVVHTYTACQRCWCWHARRQEFLSGFLPAGPVRKRDEIVEIAMTR